MDLNITFVNFSNFQYSIHIDQRHSANSPDISLKTNSGITELS